MPYEIRPQDGQFLVVDDSGKTVGTHPTRKQALEQQRALYANVQDATKEAYPFDECVKDQVERYGDEETARKVCGAIKAKYGKKEIGEAEYKEIEAELKIAPKTVTTTPIPTSAATESFITRIVNALKEGRRNSTPDEKRLQQIHDLAVENGAQCTFSVKEVGGAYRWVMVSSNSYQDRDKEIIAQAALEADVARSDKERNYGPLRWWHVGDPDPITRAPGPGIDVGTCDFRAMQGRMLIESGTFKDKRIGAAFEKRADDLAASIGFFRPINQPDTEGVFRDVHVFERSILPRSKASNPLTALTVTKEHDDMATMKEKYDEFVALLGGDTQLAQSVVTAAERTDKAAQAAGITSKETDKPADPVVVEEVKQEEPAHDDEAVDAALLERLVPKIAEKVKAMIDEKMGAAEKERTEKEAGLSAQITALDASLKEAQKALNVLGGDLPRGVKNAFRASQADATIDPNKPTIETAKEANPIGAVFNWLVQPVPPPG